LARHTELELTNSFALALGLDMPNMPTYLGTNEGTDNRDWQNHLADHSADHRVDRMIDDVPEHQSLQSSRSTPSSQPIIRLTIFDPPKLMH
jgi:hypothetical protein